MTAISIRPEFALPKIQFRALAGERVAVGRTMGEALDALVAQWDGQLPQSAVLIERFAPDTFFTQTQQERMRELLNRRDTLDNGERAELEDLVFAERDATIARTDSLIKQ